MDNNPNGANTPVDGTTVETISPNNQPVADGAVSPEPIKKKNTGLIAGIIAGAVILIGGIIAAIILVMNMNRGDVVMKAVEKIVDNGLPASVAVSGTVTTEFTDQNSFIKKLDIKLDSNVMTNSMINNLNSNVSITTIDNSEFTFEVVETYAANGDLYFKVKGINELLDKYGSLIQPMADELENLDDSWIRVSSDTIKGAFDNYTKMISSQDGCPSKVVGALKNNANSLSNIYKQYPFAASSTEKLTVASKHDTIAKIALDSDKFISFTDSVIKSGIFDEEDECFENIAKVEIDKEEIAKSFAMVPDVYVEVNGDYDFTRLYFVVNTDANNTAVDLDFSYSTNVNVTEPSEYIDLEDVIQKVSKGFAVEVDE